MVHWRRIVTCYSSDVSSSLFKINTLTCDDSNNNGCLFVNILSYNNL